MRSLTYNARPHHILLEGGQEIHGGEEFTVSHKRAAELLADTTVSVTDLPGQILTADTDDLKQLSRSALNDLAAKAGVEKPDKLRNKEQLIDALQARLHDQAAATAATQVPREADGEAQPDAEGDSA